MNRETAQRILNNVRREKSAGNNPANLTDADLAAQLDSYLKQKALRNIIRFAGLGLGTGALLRGVKSLVGMPIVPVGKGYGPMGPGPIPVPYEVDQNEDEDVEKTAEDAGGAESLLHIPWYLPTALVAGIGGIYGGYKLTDKLVSAYNDMEARRRLRKAKKKFREALLMDVASKEAGDGGSSSLGEDLDKLCDVMVKRADIKDQLMYFLKMLPSLYGVYAVPAALAAGSIAYNAASKNSRRKLLEEAVKRRAREREETHPAPVYASPISIG